MLGKATVSLGLAEAMVWDPACDTLSTGSREGPAAEPG